MTEFIITCQSELQKDGSYKIERYRELVRCKDCEHCYFASNRIPSEQNYACGKHGFDVVPDWYCADGERKPTQTNAKNNALDVR